MSNDEEKDRPISAFTVTIKAWWFPMEVQREDTTINLQKDIVGVILGLLSEG